MNRREYSTTRATFIIGDDAILRINYSEATHITLEGAKEDVAMAARISEGEKLLLLVDISGVRSVSRDARVFFSSKDGAAPFKAMTLITGSPVSKVIGNFFLGLNKLPIPLKLFSDAEEGLTWLKGFADEQAE